MSEKKKSVSSIVQWILAGFFILIGVTSSIREGSPVAFILFLLAAVIISPYIGKVLSQKVSVLGSFPLRFVFSFLLMVIAIVLIADNVNLDFDKKPEKTVFESKVKFVGKVSGLNPVITVNGKEIQIKDGRFDHDYSLQLGENHVTFILKAFSDEKSKKPKEREYDFDIRYVTKADYDKEQLSNKDSETSPEIADTSKENDFKNDEKSHVSNSTMEIFNELNGLYADLNSIYNNCIGLSRERNGIVTRRRLEFDAQCVQNWFPRYNQFSSLRSWKNDQEKILNRIHLDLYDLHSVYQSQLDEKKSMMVDESPATIKRRIESNFREFKSLGR